MNQLIIEPTDTTPEVHLNMSTAVFTVMGKFIDDNPTEFILKLNNSFSEFVNQNASVIALVFQFDYINTGGLKALLMFLKTVEQIDKRGIIQIDWKVNSTDELMFEIGEDIKSVVDLPFEISVDKN